MMGLNGAWTMNENTQRLLLEDPAISAGRNFSLRVNVETDVANTNTTGAQSIRLQRGNDCGVGIKSRLSETGRHLDNRELEISGATKVPAEACLVGDQIMQHLVRRPSRFDYLSLSYGADSPNSNNGYYSPGGSSHTDQCTDSNGFSTDASLDNPSLLGSPFDGRLQQSYQRNNRSAYERFLQKYGHTAFIDTEMRNGSEFQAEKNVFRDNSSQADSSMESSYHDSTNRLHEIPTASCTNSPNFLNLTSISTSTSANEFMSYPPALPPSSRTGQDQVLDQNLVSAAKYVYELTDGGSRPTSRASSSVRVSDGGNTNCAATNYNYFKELESVKKSIPEIPVSGTGLSKVATSSVPETCANLIDVNTKEQATTESDSALRKQVIGEPQSEQISFGSQDSAQSVNPAILEDISLAAQLSQLALNHFGHGDLNSNQFANAILSLLVSNSTNASNLTRPIPASNEMPQPVSDWNSPTSIPRTGQGHSTLPSHNTLSAQLLNILVGLGKINPSLLGILLACLESGHSDLQQIVAKLLANKLNYSNSGLNNISLLSFIGNLLSTESVRNNAELMETITSQLTAYAARVDSTKGMQPNGYNYSHMVPKKQSIRQPAGFCSETPFWSPYYRLHMADVPLSAGQYYNRQSYPEGDIDRAATIYRNSANNASQKLEAIHRWSGKLPLRNYNSMCFSRKVFLGGVPWDSTSDDLINTFSQFGNVSVLWPQKDGGYLSHHHNPDVGIDRAMSAAPKGYCYLLFEHESCVPDLLAKCTRDASNGGEYFKLSSPKFKSKSVQVIPWVISDSQFSFGGSPSNSQFSYTVFVGALHGMITAEALASIMNELFGNVIFAALDTDKHKYPIGSGRVVFRNHASYMRAVTANFVEVRTPKFTKTIQIDPFLEDSLCDICHILPGVYFCRSLDCFQYFCPNCWQKWHSINQTNHKPLRRSLKLNTERA